GPRRRSEARGPPAGRGREDAGHRRCAAGGADPRGAGLGPRGKARRRSRGARDGWRVAADLAKANVPVIVEQPIELPTRPDEPYDSNFASAGVLAKAGVRVAFTDGSNASNARNLPHQAAAAVAFGFPRDKALEAMTLEPARILGVA